MAVRLRRATAEDRVLVANLAQLEHHDQSPVTGELPGPDGRFDVTPLDPFLERHGHEAWLVELDGEAVGFALVRPVDGAAFVHSFFVVRAVRRQGVGREAAHALLRTRPGRWILAFALDNEGAAPFWRGVATDTAGASWTEGRRENGGLEFGWLELDTSGAATAR